MKFEQLTSLIKAKELDTSPEGLISLGDILKRHHSLWQGTPNLIHFSPFLNSLDVFDAKG